MGGKSHTGIALTRLDERIARSPVGDQRLGANVDIALIDVNLSDGPTGPASAAYLNQMHGVTVIFTTANPEMVVAHPHAIGVLPKPIYGPDLLSAIEYAIACRKGEAVVPPTCLKHA
ncbi:response regulator [Rhizobium paranaense]|uniref:DNA-binding LytR/AlgR family response regulator n=1 Tax=Rhizobium paranaense TaxID=1650438 RepID=A0A7W8XSN6_9HYPH|nr:response regulator [Rhizobium paranaense]MBB5574680.1 DNA-binding LytR/AlgR family response regulator [Rhizobium paranaense]